MLRFVIAIIATLELAYFYTDLPFPLAKMIDLNARWFNILSGLCMAVFAPLLGWRRWRWRRWGAASASRRSCWRWRRWSIGRRSSRFSSAS